MKRLFITIGICIFMLAGCTQQHFANSDAVRRRLQEQREYDIFYDCGMAQMSHYEEKSLDYGPQIDVVNAIWGN